MSNTNSIESSAPWWKDLRFLTGLTFAFLAIILVRNAWVSDDAFITFRSSFHLANGYGPVFNISERVQSFTNPLWMMVMAFFYLLTGEAFFTSMVLGVLLGLGSLWLIRKKLPLPGAAPLLMVLAATSSAFIDYSTSGLENGLNHLILVLFALLFLKERNGFRNLFLLSLLASLGMVNRMDTALFYAPALAFLLWRNRSLKGFGALILGMLPFVGWEVFSLIYYGFPFPNTAYVKLNSGQGGLTLFQQGVWYFLNSLLWDPVTLMAIGAGLVLGLKSRGRSVWLSVGMGLYLMYILRIGGDFMSGRFFSTPFVLALVLIARHLPTSPRLRTAFWSVLILIGVLNPRSPIYEHVQEREGNQGLVDGHGIADERAWWAGNTALLYLNSGEMRALKVEEVLDTKPMTDSIAAVKTADVLGLTGYAAGPGTHILDCWALGDPLLARLPAAWEPDWRIGHYLRILPDGYISTLKTQENKLSDSRLAEYYDHLSIVVKGPIWSKERFREIYRFQRGAYDHLINEDFYRKPGPLFVSPAELSTKQVRGAGFLAPGSIRIWPYRSLRIRFDAPSRVTTWNLALDNNDSYRVKFYLDGQRKGQVTIQPDFLPEGGLNLYRVEVPEACLEEGYDEVHVGGYGGDGFYSIGHFLEEDVRD